MKKIIFLSLLLFAACMENEVKTIPEDANARDGLISPLTDPCDNTYYWVYNRNTITADNVNGYWHYLYTTYSTDPNDRDVQPSTVQWYFYNPNNGSEAAWEIRTHPNKPGTIVQPGQTKMLTQTINPNCSAAANVEYQMNIYLYRQGTCVYQGNPGRMAYGSYIANIGHGHTWTTLDIGLSSPCP